MANQVIEIYNNLQETVATQETRQRKFFVKGPTNQLDAMNEVTVQYNDTYVNPRNAADNDSTLRVSSITPIQKVFGQWEISYHYTRPENGLTHVNPIPLNRIPTWQWGQGAESRLVDTQINLVPIMNSVGDPFEPSDQQFPIVYWTVNYYTDTWSQATFSSYTNRVNSTAWNIGGMTVPAGMALCTNFGIPNQYGSDAEVVQAQLKVAIWNGGTSIFRWPWQSRRAMIGTNAWGQPKDANGNNIGNPVKGIIVDRGGTPIPNDVALDLTGKPADTEAGYQVKVGGCLYPLCAAPSSILQTWFDYDTYTSNSKTFYYGYYKYRDTTNFNPLATIVGLPAIGGDIVGG